jgi:galactokinase
LDLTRIAHIGQMAEHRYVGVKCGIMDQFASALGKKDQAILLDCRTLDYELIDINLGDYSLLLFDSKVKHKLGDSEYNIRRAQCEKGVEIIRKKYDHVASLRDVTEGILLDVEEIMPTTVFKRCNYVIQENLRVEQAAVALRTNNIELLGQLMFKTHEGLSREYEVSCPELDFLVELAVNNENIGGSRMMGGGFGGCTINLVKSDAMAEVIDDISSAYNQKFATNPGAYAIHVSDGVKELIP